MKEIYDTDIDVCNICDISRPLWLSMLRQIARVSNAVTNYSNSWLKIGGGGH